MSVDFLSKDFNAALALSQDLTPPIPSASALDNITAFRFNLPLDHPDCLANKEFHTKSDATKKRDEFYVKRDQRLLIKAYGDIHRTPFLTRMVEHITEQEPLGLLLRSQRDKCRIRIVTRHGRGIRGNSTGYLRAFDRHMNMILYDVHEEYTVLVPFDATDEPRAPASSSRPSSSTPSLLPPSTFAADEARLLCPPKQQAFYPRIRRKLEHRTRHLKQVFLTGSSVVLISRVDDEGTTGKRGGGSSKGGGENKDKDKDKDKPPL